MADIQTINIGNLANDGLGDDLRTAFEKVNANFTDLNDELTVTVVNLGPVVSGLFKEKVGNELRFKSLDAGRKITFNNNVDSITINSSQPDAFTRFDTDSGSMVASVAEQISVQGTYAPDSETLIKDIEVTSDGSTGLKIKTVIPVTEYLTTYDFGSINGTYNNAIQLALQASNMEFGTLTYDSDLDLDSGGLT
jgi:hypothetical protein